MRRRDEAFTQRGKLAGETGDILDLEAVWIVVQLYQQRLIHTLTGQVQLKAVATARLLLHGKRHAPRNPAAPGVS